MFSFALIRSSFLPVLFCFLFSFGYSQKKIYNNVGEALAASSKLNGKNGPSSVNWIDNGTKFSYKAAGGVIMLSDPATGKEEVLFEPAKYKPASSVKGFDYSSFEWSADYKFIVFRTNVKPVWRNSGYADYYLFSRKDKDLKKIASDVYTAQLSPDGTQLGYEQKGNLFVMDLASGKTRQLTRDRTDNIYNGRFGWVYEEEFSLVQAWQWSNDSKKIAYWQTDERSVPIYRYTNYSGFKENYNAIPYPRVGDSIPNVRIGVIDLSDGKNTWIKVDADGGYIPRIYWTAESDQLAVVHLNRSQNYMKMFFANVRTGNAKIILSETSDSWINVMSFGANILHFFYFPKHKKEFFWQSERTGFAHLYRYDYNGKIINPITSGNWDVVKAVYIDDASQTVYFTSTEVSALEKHLYSIKFDGSDKKKLTAAVGNHTINFGGSYYLDTYSNVSLPKQVDLCDVNGKLIKKIESNDAVSDFIQKNAYSPKILKQFVTSDGQRLDYSLIMPYQFDDSRKYPVLLEVYGGPEHQDVSNEFETNGFDQYMSQKGYIVVKVNNRGGAGYGKAFKSKVYRNLGKWECFDFAETVKEITKNSWADPKRVAIKGHSYGGFTAAYSVIHFPDVYKAAVIAAPVSDWRLYDAVYTERFMGILQENKEGYDAGAITPFVKNIKAEVLIAHSTYDDNVHVRNSMQLIRAFIDAGKDPEMKIYQGGGHPISYDINSYIMLCQSYINFLDRALRN